MQTWRRIVMAVGISLSALILLILFTTCYARRCLRRFQRHPRRKEDPGGGFFSYGRAFSGVKELDLAAMEGIQIAAKWRDSYPIKPFDWSEYPPLMADAMDRGWAAFAFMYTCSSQCPISSADTFVLCTKCCLGEAYQPEIAWEIGPAADFMQLIRLNPRMVLSESQDGADASNNGILVQALQSALPLPGPSFGPGSFPHEGYFEITIVAFGSEDRSIAASEVSSSTDSENIKLILKPSPSEKYPLSQAGNNKANGFLQEPVVVTQNSTKGIIQARIQANSQERRRRKENIDLVKTSEDGTRRTLGVGFSAGLAPPFRLPGADKGSIGLHSNGQIFFNGMLHVDDGDKFCWDKRAGWGSVANTTVGCGYSPQSRRFFFTLNGELVGELSCGSSKEFSYPLHGVVASNYDVTLLVNFGQCSFEFIPANDQRIPDPSNFRNKSHITVKSSSIYDDSGDLFSIRRLDSQWWSHRRTSSLSQPEAEADLFEIALDGRG